MSANGKTYLTPDQVQQLNEKHGWFQYRDAQSDVSRAFAQDAISMHERIRAAAPDLLTALQDLLPDAVGNHIGGPDTQARIDAARAAITKATEAA